MSAPVYVHMRRAEAAQKFLCCVAQHEVAMYVHVGGAIQVSTLHVHMRGSSWITIFHYKQHFRPTQVDGGHVMRRDDKVLDGTSRGLFQHSPLVVFHILSRNRSYRPQCFLRMYTCAMYRRLLPVYVHLCGQRQRSL